jgi:hypothetical protein
LFGYPRLNGKTDGLVHDLCHHDSSTGSPAGTGDEMIRRLKALWTVDSWLRVHERLNRMLGSGQFVLIACMPRTASTFVSSVLVEVTGFSRAMLTHAYGRYEQELYLPKVVDASLRSSVTQQHVRATPVNLEIMKRFSMRSVVLVRNLFDVVVSVRDYLFLEGFDRFPTMYATKAFAEMTVEEQFDFIITFGMPWYFDFYVSWYDACESGRAEALWVTYEELCRDWPAGISKILQHCSIAKPRDEVVSAIERTRAREVRTIRLNEGVSGRGEGRLNEAQRDRLRGMARLYPWVDFGPVGLGAPARSEPRAEPGAPAVADIKWR